MPDQTTKIIRQPAGWRWLEGLLSLTLVALTGCFGPPTMHYDIQQYNKQALSSEEEMLLFNIGELHYGQPPHFMMLSSVSQSRTFSAGAGFSWANPATWLAGPFTATGTENPTITFVPIQGSDFAQRFESSQTEKFRLFLEDQRWSGTYEQRAWLVSLFAQGLYLIHGDGTQCRNGLYVNRSQKEREHQQPDHYYADEFSKCLDSIAYRNDLRFVQVDGHHVIPTNSGQAPSADSVVTALTSNYEWFSPNGTSGTKQTSTTNERTSASDQTSDNSEKTTASDKSTSEKSTASDQTSDKSDKITASDKNSSEKGTSSEQTNDKTGKTAASDKNTSERGRTSDQTSDKKTTDSNKTSSEKGTGKEHTSTKSGKTTVNEKTTSANSSTVNNIDFVLTNPIKIPAWLDFNSSLISRPYSDEIANDIWPLPFDYFYVELRNSAARSEAERECHSSPPSDSLGGVVCGYFKIGNLFEIMQRLAEAACHNAKDCPESVFGIGIVVPSWADTYASFTDPDGIKESVWVPAHDPSSTDPEQRALAERDRESFLDLYRLYQMSLVDTSKLVTGAPAITISK